jgi:DNA-binding XRE family transcriptional regulator
MGAYIWSDAQKRAVARRSYDEAKTAALANPNVSIWKRKRYEAGLTQGRLGDLAHVSEITVRRLENASRGVHPHSQAAIEEALSNYGN